MQANELQTFLKSKLTECDVLVQGDDGRHFELVVIGDIFASLSPVKKQQYVYASGLNDLIASGEVHAVQIRTYTPEQWQEASQLRVG